MAKSSPKKAASAAKPSGSPASTASFAEISWLNWADRRSSLLYLAVASAMLLLLFGDYLFGPLLYLFDDTGSDTLNVFYPALHHIADYLREEGLPAWSFRQGIGQNIFPNSLSDPFNYPLYALGGEKLAYGIAWMECFKLLLGGWIFSRYLRLMQMDGYVAALGGLFFAFSGYAVIGSGWYVFSSNLPQAALLLLGFEMFFQRRQWWLFPLAVGLIVAASPVAAYTYFVFLAAYALWRYFSADRARSWGDFMGLALPLIGLTLLGAALTIGIWWPSIKEMLDSPRSGVASLTDKLRGFSMFGFEGAKHNGVLAHRLFGNDLSGSALKYYGWRNYLEAPMNYCGLLCLLLLPQVFVGLSRREKIAYGALLAAFVLPQIFPYFRYAFWVFSGDYYRNFSHIFGMVAQLLALLAFVKLVRQKTVNLWLLGGTLVALLGLLYYPWGNKVFPALQFQTAAFLIVEAALIFLATRSATRAVALAGLALAVVAELTLTAWPTLHDRKAVTKTEWETGYYKDETLEAVRWIQAQDSSFYRIGKQKNSGAKIHASFNDAKVQRFNGNTSYHSFNHPGIINLHVGTGVIDTNSTRKDTLEGFTRWAQGVRNYVYLRYASSTKYLIQTTPIWTDRFIQLTTDSLTMIGEHRILRNHLSFPFGATYDRYITEEESQKLGKRQHRQSAMLMAAVVRAADVPMLGDSFVEKLADSIPKVEAYTNIMMDADVAALSRDSFQMTHFSPNHITGNIELTKKKILCLNVPLDEGWEILVDGQPAPAFRVNYAFIGLALEPGKHDIALTYHVPMLKVGAMASAAAAVVYFLLLAGSFWMARRRREAGENTDAEA